jgi:hypothetical protein
MGTYDLDRYNSVSKNMWARSIKQAPEIVVMGFSGGEHGGFDRDGVRRRG